MAFTNFDSKEIHCKIVYFGAVGSGRTTNLRAVLQQTSPEFKTGLYELSAVYEQPYYEFVPISLGRVRHFHIKMHVYVLPEKFLFDSVEGTFMRGIDGVVFVCDSRLQAMAKNEDAFNNAQRLLVKHGYNLGDLPRVIQYNHTDADDAVGTQILRHHFNSGGLPDCEAVATTQVGTLEALQLMAKSILDQLVPDAPAKTRSERAHELT